MIGVIIQKGAITSVNLKSSNTSKDRRNVIIVDESGLSISVSLWGNYASNDNYHEG